MVNTINRKLSSDKCKAAFEILPKEVVDSLKITKNIFCKTELKITIKNTGLKAAKEFYRVYCYNCEKTMVPKLLKKYRETLSKYYI